MLSQKEVYIIKPIFRIALLMLRACLILPLIAGMVTYAMGNETEAMVTLFTLGANGVNVTLNQVLADWLE